MLDNNVNQNQIPYQAVQPADLNQQGVPMQAGIPANPELLKEDIQDTYVANRVANTTDDPKGMLWTGVLAIPSWYAIATLMDKYAQKCRGDYEKTIPGKIGAFGDKVTDTVKNSTFGKSSFAASLNNGYKSFRRFIREKIVDKSRLLRAFRDTPSVPENMIVRDQAKGLLGFSATDWDQVTESFCRETVSAKDLSAYGASADEISAIESRIANLPKDKQLIELQNAEYELLKKNSRGSNSFVVKSLDEFKTMAADARKTLLKNAKAYEWGLNDFKEFEVIKKNRPDFLHRIIESAYNSNKKMFSIAFPDSEKILSRINRFLFNREVYGSEFANKMASSIGNGEITPEMADVLRKTGLDKKIPKSALGKFIAKYNNIILEGATNRVAGGKMIAIMQAWFLAEAIYKATTAEGGLGEKGKTFAERLIELIAMFACIPPAIMLLHKAGGLQYAGMTKEQVAKFREHLKIHNEKAMSGGFADKAAWKESKNALKKELRAGVKNPFVRLGKWVGRVITVGLEQIRPYDKNDIGVIKDGKKVYRKGIPAKLKDLWHHPKFGIKQMAGYPMRIGLAMIVIMPFLSKLAVKGSHLIFGKPKHSVLDEEKEQEAAEKAAEQRAQTQIPPQLQNPNAINQQAMQGNQSQINQQQPVQQQGPYQPSQTNLLNPYRNGQQYQTNPNVKASTTTTNTTVNNNENKNNEPIRTYVPSPVGVKLNGQEDVTAAEQAMQRADAAEQQALKTLKMN